MTITEVNVRLAPTDSQNQRLVAFATIILDFEFIVRDLKIINGVRGLLVTMPSRYVYDHCPQCRDKNRVNAPFCNWCGVALAQNRDRAIRCTKCGLDNSAKLLECQCGESLHVGTHADVAHPINRICRQRIVDAVLGEYHKAARAAVESRTIPSHVPAG